MLLAIPAPHQMLLTDKSWLMNCILQSHRPGRARRNTLNPLLLFNAYGHLRIYAIVTSGCTSSRCSWSILAELINKVLLGAFKRRGPRVAGCFDDLSRGA